GLAALLRPAAIATLAGPRAIDRANASPNDPALGRRCIGAPTAMEERVLIDHRSYRIKPGMVPAHLEIYEKHGFAAQSRHLGKPFAYLFTESGEVNTLVQISP